jgi:hypothetical protein
LSDHFQQAARLFIVCNNALLSAKLLACVQFLIISRAFWFIRLAQFRSSRGKVRGWLLHLGYF